MRTELERVERWLLIFTAALTALNLIVAEALVLDDLAGLVNAGLATTNRECAPGAEIIPLVLSLGIGEETLAAAGRVFDCAVEMCEHLVAQTQ